MKYYRFSLQKDLHTEIVTYPQAIWGPTPVSGDVVQFTYKSNLYKCEVLSLFFDYDSEILTIRVREVRVL